MSEDTLQIELLQRELAELRRQRAWYEAPESGSAGFRRRAVEKIDSDIEARQAQLDPLKSD